MCGERKVVHGKSWTRSLLDYGNVIRNVAGKAVHFLTKEWLLDFQNVFPHSFFFFFSISTEIDNGKVINYGFILVPYFLLLDPSFWCRDMCFGKLVCYTRLSHICTDFRYKTGPQLKAIPCFTFLLSPMGIE